jgi:anaerobic selenocysteine-containing dehydrogenase
MVRLGEGLHEADPPVKALFVYNSNPAAVAPNQTKVLAGLRRDDLFTVVHEQVMTDTCRYADVVLPATTILEQLDVHKAYGHLYVQLSEPAIDALGEAKPNTELFRLLAQRMGFDEPCFRDSDEELVRQALETDHPNMAGITYEGLKRDGWARLSLPKPYAPFAEGNFPTPSGKCELFSEKARQDGFDPLPRYEPPAESPSSAPELARRYPLQLVSAAAHAFLNSTFAHLPKHKRLESRPTIELHPRDAAARGIVAGDRVRAFNDRGDAFFWAEVGETVSPGVASHASIWWGSNVNALTSDRLADMGGGATFHDCLVQVERAPEA